MPHSSEPLALKDIRRELLRHYRRHARDLPWRRTRDPYAIWVSEVMLQQTQVDTVVPRYAEFLEQFPTVRALAQISEEGVCEAWAGLGYYRRARFLHAAARQIVEKHDGLLPTTVKGLSDLPGIGRYTAGAVASIAFGEEAPVVDGNVARVFARMFKIAGAPQTTPVQKRLWTLATALVQGDAPGDLNQAVMELGATLCTPARPQCPACPVSTWCAAKQDGTQAQYPTTTPAPKRKRLDIVFGWWNTEQGVWLVRRSLEGLWPGLWELPSESGQGARSRLQARVGGKLGRASTVVEHSLTHRRVVARAYRVPQLLDLSVGPRQRVWRTPLEAPLSALARKVIQRLAGDRD